MRQLSPRDNPHTFVEFHVGSALEAFVLLIDRIGLPLVAFQALQLLDKLVGPLDLKRQGL